MSKVIEYMRIEEPTRRRMMGGDENFNREAGWIPVPEIAKEPEPVKAQIEKPDTPNEPVKPKKRRTKKK